MKKILIASNVLLLTVILFMACNNNTQKSAEPTTTDQSADTTGETASYANRELPGLIDDSLAVIMSQAYKDDRNKAYVKGTDKLDARSIWFSLEKLKTFFAKIEAATGSGKCNLKLGIRIYYAKYPNKTDMAKYPSLAGLSDMVAGMHTLFMTPTYNHNGKDVDFNFEDVGDPCKPTPYAKLLRMNRRHLVGAFIGIEKPQAVRPGLEGVPRVENHGGLMPPPAEEGSFPTGNN